MAPEVAIGEAEPFSQRREFNFVTAAEQRENRQSRLLMNDLVDVVRLVPYLVVSHRF